MKRSERVPASLIVALAASLTVSGCSNTRTYRECVDASGRVIPNTNCSNGVAGSRWHTRTVRTGGFGNVGSGAGGGYYGG
jgi:hypothetical protein